MTEIEQIDAASAPDSLLRELSDYCALIDSEELPDDPPTPHEMRIAHWRSTPPHHSVTRWSLRDGGQIVALGLTSYDLDQNLENGFGRIHVHPAHRERGLARRLAAPVFDDLQTAGRHRLDTWVKDGDPVEGLVARMGLKAVYGETRSRLAIPDLDMELMASWVDRAQERATAYELRYHKSPFPEDLVEPFCALAHVMNTAPREDYQEDDEVVTPIIWRDIEKSVADERSQLHTLIAVHKPSEAFAGYTQIKTQELQPDLAWQWDTGVHPDHRNRGLGRWLKAALISRIVDEHPQLTRVDTFNAGSNEPMLNINIAMGFRPLQLTHVWQGDTAMARRRLNT